MLEREEGGFNYPRVHYFPRGPIAKDPEGDRKGEGEVRVYRFVLEDGITKVSLLTLINKGTRRTVLHYSAIHYKRRQSRPRLSSWASFRFPRRRGEDEERRRIA